MEDWECLFGEELDKPMRLKCKFCGDEVEVHLVEELKAAGSFGCGKCCGGEMCEVEESEN